MAKRRSCSFKEKLKVVLMMVEDGMEAKDAAAHAGTGVVSVRDWKTDYQEVLEDRIKQGLTNPEPSSVLHASQTKIIGKHVEKLDRLRELALELNSELLRK